MRSSTSNEVRCKAVALVVMDIVQHVYLIEPAAHAGKSLRLHSYYNVV
jgi:hypothetical protein